MTANGSSESRLPSAPRRCGADVQPPSPRIEGAIQSRAGFGSWWLELRRRAESRLLAADASSDRPDPDQFLHMIDDLQAYQVELELQNEELIRVRNRLESMLRNRAEERLAIPPEDALALLDSLIIPIVVLDDRLAIRHCNRAWLDFAGCEGGCVGQPYIRKLRDLFISNKDVVDRLEKDLLESFSSSSERTLELLFDREDQPEGVLLRISPHGDRARSWRVVWHEDITPRLRAEHALKESEVRFRQTVEHLPTGVCELDASLRFRYLNPAAKRLLGLPDPPWPEELAFTSLVVPEHLGLLNIWFESTPGTREDFLGELRLRPLSGPEAWVLTHIAEIHGPGGTAGFRCGLTDLTERKEAAEKLQDAETRLQQAQKMEAVGRLAGGVAHDFNNILTVLRGYAQLLQEEFSTTPEADQMLSEILDNAKRASSVTEQLLAFSRSQVLDPRRLDLNGAINETERLLRRLIGEDLSLVLDLAPNLWPVRADPGQLTQVLLNLAVNARDAMDYGGTLTIRTRNRPLPSAGQELPHAVEPGDFVELMVSDTGTGMPAEISRHIFEPFFTTKQPGKGTGLGLSTVYGIVQQSGGFIEVASEPSQGSTFLLFLPRDQGLEPVEQPQALARVEATLPATILLAEDEPSLRGLAAHLLTQAGYRVIEARDGKEALEISAALEERIDLLLSDVVMPGPSGPETHRRLLEGRPGLRALFMSGYTPEQTMRHGALRPGGNLIQKPFSPERLLAVVAEALKPAEGPARESSAPTDLLP